MKKEIECKVVEDLLFGYVDKPLNCSYTGIKIKLGMITLDDAKKMGNFICQVGKWLTYTWNDDWYIVVDSEPNEYNLPVLELAKVGIQ